MMMGLKSRPHGLLFLAGIAGWLFLGACAQPAADTEPPPDLELSELIGETTQPAETATRAAAEAQATTTVPEMTEPPATPTGTTSPTPTITPTPLIYEVQAGDMLDLIAYQFGTTAQAIQLANGLSDPNQIWPGQELIIPQNEDVLQVQPSATAVDFELVEPSLTPGAEGAAASETPLPATATPILSLSERVLHNGVPCPDETIVAPEGAVLVGRSAVCDLPIVSYQLSEGEIPVILIGGIHGGYEWNTISLAYEMLDYLQGFPNTIHDNLAVYLIPNANPDGLYAVSRQVGRFDPNGLDVDQLPGRFNGRNVDLNRNWDCNHTPNAVWRDTPIDGGDFPFSELENQALRDTILGIQPAAVLFWHSAANGVYASGCGVLDPASRALAEAYSGGSGYPVYDGFDYYDVTGDAGDWLAAQGIPAIAVELTNHSSMNWDMNLAGLRALFAHVSAGG